MNKPNPWVRPLLIVAVAMLAACAGQTRLESDLAIKGAPDWVNKGTSYVNDKDGLKANPKMKIINRCNGFSFL